MKSLFITLAIAMSSLSAQAFSGTYFTQALNSDIFKALEADATARGFQLSSVADSGDRFRCPCVDLILTFKNDAGETVTKKIRTSLMGPERVKLVD